METSQEVIIDAILNAVGYLAAGGLSIVIYSIFRGRRKVASLAGGSGSETHDDVPDRIASLPEEARRVEFIKFDKPPGDSDHANNVFTGHAGAMTAASRRNRVEVIRLARKMIEAGASADNVRSVLPISEAELALLSYDTN